MSKIDPEEQKVIDDMILAKGIADEVFGLKADADAVERVYDFLLNVKATEFVPDLKRMYSHAARIYGTDAPTPEQVFGVFERVFDVD